MKVARLLALLIAVVALVSACGRPEADPGTPDFRPPALEVLPGGWTVADGPTVYGGDSLYVYINGGADLFLEYGFSRVITCEYSDSAGNTLIVDAFEMESPLAAFGILSCRRNSGDKPNEFGYAGSVSPYMHIFCKGRYYLKIQSFGEDRSNFESRELLAGLIDKMIDAAGAAELDSVFEHIPADIVIPESRMVACGPLALNTRNYISDDNLLGLGKHRIALCTRAVDGQDTLDITTVGYDSEKDALHYAEQLNDNSRTELSVIALGKCLLAVTGNTNEKYMAELTEKICEQ